MSTQSGSTSNWKTALTLVANSAPALLSGAAYLADVVSPEVAAWTALGGTVTTALGTAIVNCPYVTGKSISGVVSPTTNETITGIEIEYSGTSAGSITTTAGGAYSSPWLAHGGTYKLTPKVPYHDVTPKEITVSNLTANRTGVNFKLKRRTVTLKGRVQPAANEQVRNLKIKYSGASSGSTQTGENGNFAIPGLLEGGAYKIETVVPDWHRLDRSDVPVATLLPEQEAITFTLTRNKITVTGAVTPGGAQHVGGLTVRYSGATDGSVQTRENGTFSIPDLLEGGQYRIAPDAVAHHTFEPVRLDVAQLAKDPAPSFQFNRNKVDLHGKISPASGEQVRGITVSYSGETSGSTTTKGDGTFTIPGLLEDGDYTIAPVAPAFHTLNHAKVDIAKIAVNPRADFILTRQKFSISGRVISKTINLQNVTIRWEGDTEGSTTTTDKGEFVISNLPAGGTYRIIPEKLHYEFDPPEGEINPLKKDVTDADFSIRIAIYSISGLFRDFVPGRNTEEDNGPLSDVAVMLTGDVQDKTRTGNQGTFRFEVPALGKYELQFVKGKVEFEPASPIRFDRLTSTWDREIEARDPSWQVKGKSRPPRAPRWYDALPRDNDGWVHWDVANSIASGRGVHSADHLPGLIAAVGQGPFTRTDVLPRIVAYAIRFGHHFRTNPGISRHYSITGLPHQNGSTIPLNRSIVVVWNFVVNPLTASAGTVYEQ
jgi:hypothetical protein